jgi:hypothetical protein
MSTGPSGIYIIASTTAEGVLFRHTTGLSYDTVVIQYRLVTYLVNCATGQPPAWHPYRSVPVSKWLEWLPTQEVIREARWIALDAVYRHELARFIADVCLSRPTVWKGWSPNILGTLLDLPATPVPVPNLPLSVWETMMLPVPPPSISPLTLTDTLSHHVDAWVQSIEKETPPIIDLNALLTLTQRPTREGTTSLSAILVVMPLNAPKTLTVPEASGVVTLSYPCLDSYTYQDIEKLNLVLHSPDFIHQELYDELRDECQKKLSTPTKRWPTHS